MAENQDLENSPIKAVVEKAIQTPMDKLAKVAQKEIATKEQVNTFLKKVGDNFGIPPETAFTAAALLFLKGAANKGTPLNTSVEVFSENKWVTITKYDIMMACLFATEHKFLRRIAEAIPVEISKFAESKNLNGDLAIKLNNDLVAAGQPPLNSKEKAWASSFNQNIPNLDKLAGERIPTLLAQDYRKRFLEGKRPTINPETVKPKEAPSAPPAASKKEQEKKKTNFF